MGQEEEAPVRALCRLKGDLRGTLRVHKGGRGLALVGEENASPGSPCPSPRHALWRGMYHLDLKLKKQNIKL